MGSLSKQLRKFSAKERLTIEQLTEKIIKQEFRGLDYKKLKGMKNIFRVRKGKVRIIFELEDNKESHILTIERRRESIYKF